MGPTRPCAACSGRRRRRREQLRLAVHARAAAVTRATNLRGPDTAILRARLAAQHAASVVRRACSGRRVQVAQSLRSTGRKVQAGVGSMAAGVRRAMGQQRKDKPARRGSSAALPGADAVELRSPSFVGKADGEAGEEDEEEEGDAGGDTEREQAYEEAEQVRRASPTPTGDAREDESAGAPQSAAAAEAAYASPARQGSRQHAARSAPRPGAVRRGPPGPARRGQHAAALVPERRVQELAPPPGPRVPVASHAGGPPS